MKHTLYWHVAMDTTKPALERMMRALIVHRCEFSGAFMIGSHQLGRGVSAFATVGIPAGSEEAFCTDARPITMHAPPQVHVGTAPPPPDDGHPGRHGVWTKQDPWRVLEDSQCATSC